MVPKLKLAEEKNCYYFRQFINEKQWNYKAETTHGVHQEITFNVDGKITSEDERLVEILKNDPIGQNIIQQNKTIIQFLKNIDIINMEVSIEKEHIIHRKDGTKDYGFYVKVKNEPIVIWSIYNTTLKHFVVHGVFVHNDPKKDPIKRAIHEVSKKDKQLIILALKECIKKESKYRVKLLVDNTFHK